MRFAPSTKKAEDKDAEKENEDCHMEEDQIALEIRLGTGLYDHGDPLIPTHFSTYKNQDTRGKDERREIQNRICNMLNDASSHDTTTDEDFCDNEAPPCTNDQDNMYKDNFTRMTNMAKNYNLHTTFNMASFDIIIVCLEMMDPDHLAYNRIMSTGHEDGRAPTKQQLLNIFEFC
eukprot:8503011-Heterocapsa_arctica.AAC.1